MSHRIVWLTGQSGSGKTTVAKALQEQADFVILDGDEMRASISVDEGFSREDRARHNNRVCRLAAVLAEQKMVVVSVIAPMREVRQSITETLNPTWVYVKRTMPEREGHFYEEPEEGEYFTLDHDVLSVEESVEALRTHLFGEKKVYSLFIGRYAPLHRGHETLMRHVLDEGKNVLVALRDTPISDSDPFSLAQRHDQFGQVFEKEIADGRVKVVSIPDIEDVCYGRKVGWGIRQIKLDEDTEAISATKIREQMNTALGGDNA